MTTIAWDGKTLAADTLATSNGLRDNKTIKIWRHGGALIGACGSQALCERFRTWAIAGMEGKSPFEGADDGNGLVVTQEAVLCFGNNGCWKVSEPFYTLGSGYQLALGALAMGATAKQAVEVAAKYDTSTGGEITALSLEV